MREGNDFLAKIKQCIRAIDDWERKLCLKYREAINSCSGILNSLGGRRCDLGSEFENHERKVGYVAHARRNFLETKS